MKGGRTLEAGFSLLELMVAIAVLAVAMTAIMSAQQAGMGAAVMIKRGQAAALIIKGVVYDIEEEYKQYGFPENSIEDRECEVPDEFDDLYECSYDLKRIDLEPEQIQALVDQSFGGLLGDGGLSSLASGDTQNLSDNLQRMVGAPGQGGMSGLDLSGLAFLLPFLGPEGEALMSLCNVNLSMLVMGFMGVQSFVPMVLQEVSNRTRQLTVRLAWSEGPFGAREFSVTTFITSLPEEQLEKLKEMEDAKEVLEGTGGLGRGLGPRGTEERGVIRPPEAPKKGRAR